jgi:hypothetical protein
LPAVLKGLSFSVMPREKIGIVSTLHHLWFQLTNLSGWQDRVWFVLNPWLQVYGWISFPYR